MRAISGRTQNYGVLPSRSSFDAIVAAHMANPGPIVLDIEKLPLKGSPGTIRQHLQVLETLADWTHADAPGKTVGYYGYNTLTGVPPANRSYAQELAHHVDAFFPSMYTFDDNQAAWATRAATEAAEDRALASGKPVFFYMWPQYHDGTPKQFQYIDAAYWQFQLNTAYLDADGVVLWVRAVLTGMKQAAGGRQPWSSSGRLLQPILAVWHRDLSVVVAAGMRNIIQSASSAAEIRDQIVSALERRITTMTEELQKLGVETAPRLREV
jgi:hypothetical protein